MTVGSSSASAYDKNDNETSLSEERVQKLIEIGFIFDVHEAQWLERLEELRKYRRDHGDTLVPKHYPVYPHLGRWVDKQRLDYKRYMAKKKLKENDEREVAAYEKGDSDAQGEVKHEKEKSATSLQTAMTEERIRLLEAENFIWDPFNYAWEMKLDELQNFVALNGHGGIREQRGKGYDPLARWAEVQRSHYRKHIKGIKTPLTQDRIAKLNAIGFVWDKATIWETMKGVRSAAKKLSKGINAAN